MDKPPLSQNHQKRLTVHIFYCSNAFKRYSMYRRDFTWFTIHTLWSYSGCPLSSLLSQLLSSCAMGRSVSHQRGIHSHIMNTALFIVHRLGSEIPHENSSIHTCRSNAVFPQLVPVGTINFKAKKCGYYSSSGEKIKKHLLWASNPRPLDRRIHHLPNCTN